MQKKYGTIKEASGPKRLPSRSGRDGSQTRKTKNASGSAIASGTITIGNDDYAPNAAINKYKTLYYSGRPVTKEEFVKDFLELKTESEKVKMLG